MLEQTAQIDLFCNGLFWVSLQNLIIKHTEMSFENVQFHSPEKQGKRNSILKGRSSIKQQTKKQQKGLSTTIRPSVTFKQPHPELKEQSIVKQFIENSNKDKTYSNQRGFCITESNLPLKTYNKWTFIKDVNNINHLYNEVLIMASSNTRNFNQTTNNKELVQMSKTIEDLVYQNIKIKQQVDQLHKVHCDLHELGDYLNCSYEQLTKNGILDSFLEKYSDKQKQWRALQQLCRSLPQQSSKHKAKGLTEDQIRDKEKKCQILRKKLQREKAAVKKLQKEEKQLLKELYRSQKESTKNERLSSALKLKINQLETDKQYNQGKSKAKPGCKQAEDKENIYPSNQLKHLKIQNKELLKSKSSLAKLIRK